MKLNYRQSGVAAIEFIVVLPIFISVLLIFFDISRYFLLQGQLNRTSYSLVTMLAHREQFYLDQQNQKKPLDASQTSQLHIIANRLLSDQNIGVTAHEISRFDPTGNNDYRGFSVGSACGQKNAAQLRQLYQSIDNPTVDTPQTLYVVELCQPILGFSLFARFTGAAGFGQLYASSIMVER